MAEAAKLSVSIEVNGLDQAGASIAKFQRDAEKAGAGAAAGLEQAERAVAPVMAAVARMGRDASQSFDKVDTTARKAAEGVRTVETALKAAFQNPAGLKVVNAELEKQRATLERINRITGVSGGGSGSGIGRGEDIAAYGKQLDALRAKYNPLFAIGQQYRQEVEAIQEAHRLGAISVHEMQAAIEDAGVVATTQQAVYTRLRRGLGDVEEASKLTGNQLLNLSRQGNDVITMWMSGADVLTIFGTQIGQVYGVLEEGPRGLRGSVEAIGGYARSLIGAINPVTAGVVAIGTAAVATAYVFREQFPDVEETLKTHEDLLKRIGAQYDGLGEKIAKLSEGSSQGFQIDLATQAENLEKSLAYQQRELQEALTRFLPTGPQMTPERSLLPEFDSIREQIEPLLPLLEEGKAGITAFGLQLEALYNAAGTTDEMRAAIREFRTLSDAAVITETAIRANALAVLHATPEYQRMAAAVRAAGEAFGGFQQLIPNTESQFDALTRRYNEFIAANENIQGPTTALRDYNLAVQELGRDAASRLKETENALANVALPDAEKALAEVRQRYEAEIEAYERLVGDEAGLNALRQAMDNDLARVRIENSQKVAEEREKEAERAAKEAEREAERAQREIDRANEATEARIRGVQDHVEAMELELSLIGLSEGEAEAARFAFEGLAAAKEAAARSGMPISQAEIDAIRAGAQQVGVLTTKLDEATEAQRQMEDLGKDLFEGLIDAIGSGENALDSLMDTFAQFGRQLASAGLDKIFGGLFGGATAGGSGGGLNAVAGALTQIASRPSAPSFGSALSPLTPVPAPGYVERGGALAPLRVELPSSASSSVQRAGNAFLDLIGRAEGTDRGRGYNESLGYGAFTGGPRNLVSMSLDQIDALQTSMLRHTANTFNSSALGRYQIVRTTLRGLREELGLSGNQLFTPELQDELALQLAQRRGPNVAGLRNEWEGFRRVSGDELLSAYGSINSTASSTNDMARAVSAGTLDATRKIASGAVPAIGGGAPFGPLMSNQAGAALANGWSGFGPMPGASGAGGGGLFGERGQAMLGVVGAGVGAFSMGQQSGSPLMGGVGGALSGLGAAGSIASAFPAIAGIAGPVGMIAGAGLGILGGLFGGSKEREKKHRQQQQAWEQMLPQWREFQEVVATGTGPSSGLADTFKDMTAQFETFMEVGADAWKYGKENSTELHHQVGQDLYDFKERTRAAFRDTWDSILESLEGGRGLTTPFVEARDAIVAVGDQLKTFVEDTSEAFYGDPVRIEQAQEAARQQALMMLEPVEALSQIQSDVESFHGAAAALRTVLVDLGMTTEDAATAVEGKLTAALGRLGETIEQDLRDQIAELDGRGYLADFRALIEGNVQQIADIAASGLNVDTSLVETLFAKQAQALVDGAELAGDAFAELIRLFPQLAGVVTAFGASGQAAVDRATADLDRAMAAHTEEVNERIGKLREEASEIERTVSQLESFVETIARLRQDLLVNDDLSPLSNRERMLEARDQFRDLADRLKSEDQAIREAAMAELPGASQEYLDESRQFYASSEAYYEAFDEVQRVLAETELTAKSQLSEAQRQLLALERSIAAEEAGLLKLQEQIDALLKIDESVLSIGEAMGNLAGAIEAMAAARAVGGGGGGGGGVVRPGTGPANPGSEREVAYLNANPDVRKAIEAGNWFGAVPGDVESAVRGHYALHGRNEGRNYAMGGLVLGPGSGTSDSIAAWLSNGEHITRAASVNAHTMPVLDHINRLGRLPEIRMPEMPRFVGAGNDNGNQERAIRDLQRDVQALGRIFNDVIERQTKRQVDNSAELQRRAESSNRMAQRRASLTRSAA